jgi:SPP1 family predicted phage head-tail adaptor
MPSKADRFIIGALDELVTLQHDAAVPVVVSALVSAAGVATARAPGHGFSSGDEVEISGADAPPYLGRVVVTVVDVDTFTYAVPFGTPDVANGTITATYQGDGQGGRRDNWQDVATVWASVIAAAAIERIQTQAMTAAIAYHVRIWDRPDVHAADRLTWGTRTLEIVGLVRTVQHRIPFLELDCTEAD